MIRKKKKKKKKKKVTGPSGPVIIACHWPELARRVQIAGGPAGQCLLWRPVYYMCGKIVKKLELECYVGVITILRLSGQGQRYRSMLGGQGSKDVPVLFQCFPCQSEARVAAFRLTPAGAIPAKTGS